ncbi:MAG: hypothetical protein AAGF90_05715 [Pseudomonadota bacterium]
MTGVKMVTCCYCGARDVMRVGKGARVTLSCLTCGAPVKKVEEVRANAPAPAPIEPPKKINKHRRPKHFDAIRKRKKKRKSLFNRLVEEIDDVFDLDDIFDFD